MDIAKLQDTAKKVRIWSIKITTEAGSGHPGGSLSSADIFTSLYFGVMKHDAKNPALPERDRFVLSAGHICPALYSTMALAGYFPEEELHTLRKMNSRLQGHPSRKALPGIETSTGSLAQGIGVSVGLALGAKMNKASYRVYCLMGDGEQNEGAVWEAAMSASQFRLDNLCAIVDFNSVQQDGPNNKVMAIEPLADKYKGFGWNVLVINGHSFQELLGAFEKAKKTSGMPTVIIAQTHMGHGVSFMEDDYMWHGKTLSKEQSEKAIAELEGRKK